MPDITSVGSIQYILELDRNARERVEQAAKEVEEIKAEADKKIEEMRERYRGILNQRLETEEKACKEESDKKIALIEKNKNEKIAAFDKVFEENRRPLEQQIFDAVIGKRGK